MGVEFLWGYIMIVDGKKIAQQIEAKLKKQIIELNKKNINPALLVVQVGDDKSSTVYINKKRESAERLGLDFCLYKFPAKISEAELISEIKKIQKKNISGLIVQLPLPRHLDSKKIIEQINPLIDVDCLTTAGWGSLIQGTNIFEPPTAGAMMEILRFYKINLTGKEVVVIGRGNLVGKPLALLLMQEDCTVTICHDKTKDLSTHTKKADIIFTGVGKKNLLTGAMIKKDAIIIDAGISFDQNKMVGDIDFFSINKKASLTTPTPGGVGPITVVKLIENVVIGAGANLS